MTNPRPKVTIVCVTYNQEDYVKQALDSFVMQDVNFPFEVVVADDASTDNTPKIIEDYSQKHPDIFRPILRKKNVGVAANFFMAFQEAKGEYIALCEGDDYWTDPKKLQIQSDYLDKNKDKALCFHIVKVFFENDPEKDFLYPTKGDNQFTLERLVKENFIQTNSVMYRTKNYEGLPTDILPVDWYLHLFHAQSGGIGFIEKNMAAYRKHEGGIWWNEGADLSAIWLKHGVKHLRLYEEILKLYSDHDEYAQQIISNANNLIGQFVETDIKHGSSLLRQIQVSDPAAIVRFIRFIYDVHLKQDAESKDQHAYIDRLHHAVADKEKTILKLEEELHGIKNSRVWKTRNKVAKMTGRQVID